MARELVIVWAGRHQRSSWEDLCSTYRRKISHMAVVLYEQIYRTLTIEAGMSYHREPL